MRHLPFVQTGDGARKALARTCLHIHCQDAPDQFKTRRTSVRTRARHPTRPQFKTRRASASDVGKGTRRPKPANQGHGKCMASSWTSGKAPAVHCHIFLAGTHGTVPAVQNQAGKCIGRRERHPPSEARKPDHAPPRRQDPAPPSKFKGLTGSKTNATCPRNSSQSFLR